MRLLSILKLHLFSLRSSSSLSPHYYHSCSRSMLHLLCRWKDADIMEWQQICNILSGVCSRMSGKLVSLQKETQDSCHQEHERIHLQYREQLSALEEEYRRREEAKNQDLEKLQQENTWLQNRLAEKLQQIRHQSDIIDEIKKELLQSVQRTEISEGRRLCYEHKIKQLEEQLQRYVSQHGAPSIEIEEDKSSAAYAEINRLKKSLIDLQQEKDIYIKTYHSEIAKLREKLQRQEGAQTSSEVCSIEKLTEVQTDLAEKKKAIALLQDIVEDQYCQLRDLHKEKGMAMPSNTKLDHLKGLLGKEPESEVDVVFSESKSLGS
ncbi:hypothetical protein CpB0648 [Chlamydia pneumoniae TW-183]|uniref:Uncharacterized protein n=4 Tax=Chlamydia pneumoniae TaxID=83558 RepID=Q9Z7T2_CHLPN|nr:CT503 hypothetical protein [Chlamydia pneumoniae CWL029]AAF38008.1 conserved hypothetical protein [Chlamydia pneumoniae AR39]AAP98577.1 hypothetical protein CpB0648 [Chlamydia pneumoniae TW-183]CRI33139.1 Uncharacterized protein BN1224_Wien1_A_06460 [Chlamydia pneumoniae]BAA98829.1 CT503 hypothetical protein [Chlamydia pneumoniae J138]